MKILVRILIVLVVLIALVAIIGMFFKSEVHMERTATLKSSADAIFTQINDLNKWDCWMPFNKMDPNMKKTYGEKMSGEGATYSWESENSNVGNGSITITRSVPNELLETALDFRENGKATSAYKIEPAEGGTKVTWGFDADMGSNPFKKIMGAFMDKMMGGVFDQGLKSLDSCAAAMPPPPPPPMIMDSAALPSDTAMAK